MLEQDLIDRIEEIARALREAGKEAERGLKRVAVPATSDDIANAATVARLVDAAGEYLNKALSTAAIKTQTAELIALGMKDED